MAKVFELDFRKGTLTDNTIGQCTIAGSKFKKGDKGISLKIDGESGSGITLPSTITLNTNYSIVTAIRNSSPTTGYKCIVGDGSKGAMTQYGGQSRPILMSTNGNYVYFTDSNNYRKDGKWHLWIFTVTNNVVVDTKCYVDEDSLAISASSGTALDTLSVTKIGNRTTGIDGDILYVKLYDHVLTEAERAKAYNDFLHSYPRVKEKYPNVINKPMDLSREVDDTLGSESIANNLFNFTSGWVTPAGWEITDGKLVGTNATGNTYQVNRLTVGKKYRIEFAISDYVSGSVKMQAGSTIGSIKSGNGTYIQDLVCTLSSDFLINGETAFNGSIDYVSVKELTGLIAAYNFIPNGNTLVDISGEGNNHTIIHGQTTKKGILFNQNKADGTSITRVSLTAPHTIAFRVLLKDNTDAGIISDGGSSDYIRLTSSNIWYKGDGGTAANIGVACPQDKWFDVVLVRDSTTTVSCYFNGVFISEVAVTGSTFDYTGFANYSTFPFWGEIEDFRIFNRALSATEAKEYHNQFVKPSLVIDFKDEGADGIAKVPSGSIINSGTFAVKEDSDGKYLECLTSGSISYNGVDLSNAYLHEIIGEHSFASLSSNGLKITMVAGNKLRKIICTNTQTVEEVENTDFTLTSTGTGAGVSTLTLTTSADMLVTLGANAKFYSDSGGTADESSTFTFTTGQHTRYIKCTTGTATMTFDDVLRVTQWNAWTSGTNAASLDGDVSKLVNLTRIDVRGNNTISGDLSPLTFLTNVVCTGSNTLTGDLSLLILLTNIVVSGANTFYGDISFIVDGITGSCIILGNNQLADYTTGATWSNVIITINPAAGYGYSATEIDNMLIDMAASVALSGKTITLQGSSAAPTAASIDALNTLRDRGNTVVTNETIGSELVVNGDFASDITGYTAVRGTASWDAGTLKVVHSNADSNTFTQSVQAGELVSGKRYRISMDLWNQQAGSISYDLKINSISQTGGLINIATIGSWVTSTFDFISNQSGPLDIRLFDDYTPSSAEYGKFDNISVKEIT